ncbi:MAG: hypothetical protein NVS9B10_23220 [Nevskia sp.]
MVVTVLRAMDSARSTSQTETGPMHSRISEMAAADADSRQIADLMLCIWRDVDSALSPVIGQRGVAALYKRSLTMIGSAYPWLIAGIEDSSPRDHFIVLQAALSEQQTSAAIAAGTALLQTFHDLLARLVGAALTERLIGSIWSPRPDRDNGQDRSQ